MAIPPLLARPIRCQRCRQVTVPDAVFAVFAAGIGLVAVAVAKTWVDAQPDFVAGRARPQLAQHVDRTGIDGNAVDADPSGNEGREASSWMSSACRCSETGP